MHVVHYNGISSTLNSNYKSITQLCTQRFKKDWRRNDTHKKNVVHTGRQYLSFDFDNIITHSAFWFSYQTLRSSVRSSPACGRWIDVNMSDKLWTNSCKSSALRRHFIIFSKPFLGGLKHSYAHTWGACMNRIVSVLHGASWNEFRSTALVLAFPSIFT